MAIKIYSKYNPRANPANADYPTGSIKDRSVPGAVDGTPLTADFGNDIVGFTDALLTEANIAHNGRPDTARSSDRLRAILKLIQNIKGTGASDVRTNSQNDARFGLAGTGSSQQRSNSQNDARFMRPSDVVNNLTSDSTTAPLSAAMGKKLVSEQLYYKSETLSAPSLNLTAGSCKIVRVGDMVTITGRFDTPSRTDPGSANGYIPSWAVPSNVQVRNVYELRFQFSRVEVTNLGNLKFWFNNPDGSNKKVTDTGDFTISYTVGQ